MLHRTRKSKLSVFALVGSLSAVAAFAPSQALAQGADEIEEVVVSGFRQSLEAGLETKRNAVGSVDQIVAEDIADFPDNNLAESLQRIPGVSIDRAGGEGRNVTVRGLSSTFTRTLVNGMEVISTSGFTDALAGATRNRTFDFNTFDSDLFRTLTVKKTPDAQTDEGSLGATIELQSARPFDFDEMTVSASLQAGFNDLADETDTKAAALFSNTFADGRFGVLLGFSYSDRTIVEEGASSVRWANVNTFGTVEGAAAGAEFDEANAAFRPRLPRYDFYTHNITRTGINAALQAAPTDAVEITLDILTSNHEADREERFLQGIMNNTPINQASDLAAFEVDATNTMLFGSVTDGVMHSESRRDELETDFTVMTLSGKFDISDSFRVNGLIGSSDSEFSNPVQTSINLRKTGVDWSWDYRNGRVPVLDFGAAGTDFNNWTTASFRLRPLSVDNTFDTVKVDFEYDLNDAVTLSGGFSTKEYDFATEGSRRPSEDDAGITSVPSNIMQSIDGGNTTWATVDFDAYLALVASANPGAFTVDPRPQDVWTVNEETTSIFAQLDFETSIGDVPLRGNLGFRNIDTDQTSTSFGSGDLSDTVLTGQHSYDELLPSLNLVWETSEDILVRFSWATVIARSGLANLRPNVNVSVSGGARTISGGNPALEPTKAKAFDLALEYYFAEESLLSLAVFHKDIETFVQNFGQTILFSESGLDPQLAVDACAAGDPGNAGCAGDTWDFSAPFNAPGGDLYGFEVSYQQPFTFLPGIWSNLGVFANFTYVDAELDYIDGDGVIIDTQNFTNLSQTAHNFTLYYEDDLVMARMSLAHRDGYLTRVPGRNANELEGTHATTNLDASLSVNVTDYLTITAEILNITDEADDQWVDQSGDRPSFYHVSGTQTWLGARVKF